MCHRDVDANVFPFLACIRLFRLGSWHIKCARRINNKSTSICCEPTRGHRPNLADTEKQARWAASTGRRNENINESDILRMAKCDDTKNKIKNEMKRYANLCGSRKERYATIAIEKCDTSWIRSYFRWRVDSSEMPLLMAVCFYRRRLHRHRQRCRRLHQHFCSARNICQLNEWSEWMPIAKANHH